MSTLKCSKLVYCRNLKLCMTALQTINQYILIIEKAQSKNNQNYVLIPNSFPKPKLTLLTPHPNVTSTLVLINTINPRPNVRSNKEIHRQVERRIQKYILVYFSFTVKRSNKCERKTKNTNNKTTNALSPTSFNERMFVWF